MTITRTRRAGLAAVAVALGAAWPAAATGLPDPKTTTDGGKTTITVLTANSESTYTPKGGKPGPFPEDEDFVPKVGDVSTDTTDYMQDGVKVGGDSGACTVIKVVETEVTLDCDITATFARGTLNVPFEVTFDLKDEEDEDEVFVVDIAGGTGAYQGAEGTASVKGAGDGHQEDGEVIDEITFTFTTAGGQVSQVPSGASHSGAVHGAGGVDAGLIALGAAALGGGAVLLTARARVARRVN